MAGSKKHHQIIHRGLLYVCQDVQKFTRFREDKTEENQLFELMSIRCATF